MKCFLYFFKSENLSTCLTNTGSMQVTLYHWNWNVDVLRLIDWQSFPLFKLWYHYCERNTLPGVSRISKDSETENKNEKFSAYLYKKKKKKYVDYIQSKMMQFTPSNKMHTCKRLEYLLRREVEFSLISNSHILNTLCSISLQSPLSFENIFP